MTTDKASAEKKSREVGLLVAAGGLLAGYVGFRALAPHKAPAQPTVIAVTAGGQPVATPAGTVRPAVATGGAPGVALAAAPVLRTPDDGRFTPSPGRRDPFRPLPETAKAESGRSGPVPTLPGVGQVPETAMPGSPITQTGLRPGPAAVAPRSQAQAQVQAPGPPADLPFLMGTAVGQDSVALFQNGPAAIERKTGEYVWSYRITRIDHGRVGLINEHGAEHWVLPGQTVEGTAAVVPGGAVSGSPTAAIGSPAAAAPEAARSRSAGGILVGPRTTAQLSVGDSPLPLVRKAD